MSHFNTNCKFKNGLLANTQLESVSRALKAISHPLRLQILCTLGRGEANVQDIVTSVGTTQSNISQHLSVMRAKGVVNSRKEANRVYYHIIDAAILRLVGHEKTASDD